MAKRSKQNPNLTIHQGDTWNDLPVLGNHYDLADYYLYRMHDVMMRAVEDFNRTWGVRVDLRVPAYWQGEMDNLMTRFVKSLNEKLWADQQRKMANGQRVYPNRLRYIWVRERDTSDHFHYHVCLFFNRDAYFTLGKFRSYQGLQQSDIPEEFIECSNMARRIEEAWASSLRVSLEHVWGCVTFPPDGSYTLNVNSPEYPFVFQALFKRLSYFAKLETKHYGDRSHNFGCSRG
jgi:hypothetical protein